MVVLSHGGHKIWLFGHARPCRRANHLFQDGAGNGLALPVGAAYILGESRTALKWSEPVRSGKQESPLWIFVGEKHILSILKKIGKSRQALTLAGKAIALWLRLVHKTSRLVNDPAPDYARVSSEFPAIIALWHGQHFMVPLVRQPDHKVRALVSRSGDGHLNSVAAESLGVEVVRGSGGRNRAKTLSKGGIAALKNLVSTLAEGLSVVMTVNVPKTGARECGMGVIQLAKLSGRPIIPAAYASARRIDMKNTWDQASINLPFSKASFVIGDPIYLDRDIADADMEEMRIFVESELNRVTEEAYGLIKRG